MSVDPQPETPGSAPVPPSVHLDPDQPPHVLLPAPQHVRRMALVILTSLAVLAVLRWASAFFIPLMLGFVFYYALAPLVEAMARIWIPRALSAAVLIVGILAVLGGSLYSMVDDANDLIASLPQVASKLREEMRRSPGRASTPIETVQKAAAELERAAEEAGAPAPAARNVQRVVVEKPRFDIREHLWNGTLGLVGLVGQVTLVTFLTYFLLLSGTTFRRKLVRITGPGLAQKKLTVQALDEINAQIQRYLLVQLVVSAGVGLATGVAFAMLGLKHAAVWGVAAGLLNLVPYVGSILVTGAAAVIAFVQFGKIDTALAVAGASLLIHAIAGNLLTPWLTSRTSQMNAVSVFIGVLAWGWLWGIWGLLLGVPIMMVIKAICDRVDHLKPVGELLGT